MNLKQAVGATKSGAVAAVIVAVLTWALTAYAIRNDSSGALALWNDSTMYIVVFFMFVGAYAMYRQSRVASVLVFISYAADRIAIGFETDIPYGSMGLLITLVFLYFLGKAVYGSFVYHRIKKQENPHKRTSKWVYALSAPFVLVLSLILVLGVGSMLGVVPSTRVLAGSEVRDKDINLLRERNIISTHENIRYFYSEGIFSILEGGNILTDDRVISYYTDEDEIYIDAIDLDDISEVEVVSEASAFEDGYYRVYSKVDGDWLELLLSDEQKADVPFLKKLRDRAANNERFTPRERMALQ